MAMNSLLFIPLRLRNGPGATGRLEVYAGLLVTIGARAKLAVICVLDASVLAC